MQFENSSAAAQVEKGRVEALDLLRLVAVFGVMCFHFCFFGPEIGGKSFVAFPDWANAAKYGYLGVQLFFVISGFVIAFSAMGRSAATFAIARFSRIYPAFLFCMTLTFLFTLAFGQQYFEAPLQQWFANLFIVAPALKQPYVDGVYWTLILELTFYAWVYLLMLGGIFPRYVLPTLAAWFAISLCNELWVGSHVARKLLLTDQCGFFGSGVLIFEISRGRATAAVQSLLGCAAVLAVVSSIRHIQEMSDMTGAIFDVGIVAALALCAVGVTIISARITRLPIPPKVTQVIGGVTYPLYLLHQMIGYVAFLALGSYLAAGPLLAIIGVGVAVASWMVWRFVERPGQRATKNYLTGLVDRLKPMVRGLFAPSAPPAVSFETGSDIVRRIRAKKLTRFAGAPAA